MSLTPKEEAIDIEKALDEIETVIVENKLPNNLGGNLMSESLIEFHSKLSDRLSALQDCLKSSS